MFKRIYNHKYFKFFVGILYSILFYIGYQEFLYGAYLYAGFDLFEVRLEDTYWKLYTLLLIIIPIFFYMGVKQISSFLSIFIYYVLYIPIVITFYLASDNKAEYIMFLQSLFCFGMSLLFLADRFGNVKVRIALPTGLDVFKIVLVLTWIGTAYIAFIYRGSLKFSSYEDVYIQRSATAALGDDLFTAYIGAWLANVFIPVSATYGLFSKKYVYFFSSMLGSLIFYMATADKSILLFPLMIFAIYRFLKNRNLSTAFSAIGLGLIGVMIISLIFIRSLFSALFWMRTLGNGGMLTNYYHKYFENHPKTYYSHINVINAISKDYPYGNNSLGQMVGREYWSYDMNANANFWATDGIASIGDWGIIVSSVILFFIFIVFNRIGSSYNKVFLLCILIPYTSILLNQSLFSSLVTGGGFLILLFLSLQSTLKNPYINENHNNNRSKATVH